jgi:hypothetical protein
MMRVLKISSQLIFKSECDSIQLVNFVVGVEEAIVVILEAQLVMIMTIIDTLFFIMTPLYLCIRIGNY